MFKNMIFVENIFQLYNLQMKPLRFVLDWDTDEKFYFNMLKVSIYNHFSYGLSIIVSERHKYVRYDT